MSISLSMDSEKSSSPRSVSKQGFDASKNSSLTAAVNHSSSNGDVTPRDKNASWSSLFPGESKDFKI